MKGIIKKTEQGLIIKYSNPTFTNESLPVHPIDVNLLKDGDEVEFTVVEEWSEYLSLLVKYGKIIAMNNIDKQIQDSILKGKELETKMENFWDDMLNDPDVPQDMKDRIIEDREKLKKNAEEYKKYLKENKHRKIIGYNPENFEPIYE